jgi:6-phosphogluconolactonase
MTSESSITRRDFLAAAAAVTGLAACTRPHTDRGDTMPDDGTQQLWIGTYTDPGVTEGVHLVRLDTRTGALARHAAFDVGPNPSFLALGPKGQVLYAVNEVTELAGQATGGVSAFAVAGAGALARLGPMRQTRGGAPCYVSVTRDGGTVLVANYVGGNVAAFRTTADGVLADAAQVDQHAGTGPNAERQEGPHAHSIVPDPTGRWALSADLGADRVYVYALEQAAGGVTLRRASEAAMTPGSGPRHLAFHPTLPLVFVANELDNTVSTLQWDAASGTLGLGGSVSTLPAGWSGKSQVADIHLAPDARTLYVSNRGHDSIAVFSGVEGGTLTLVQHASTEGHWPRNFGIDPSGRWLLVANERSNAVVVLARDESSGRLTSTGQRLAIPKPVCVRYRG